MAKNKSEIINEEKLVEILNFFRYEKINLNQKNDNNSFITIN